MRVTRSVTVLLAAMLSLILQALPASAAPPGNDALGGATVASLDFSQTLDTTEATTDADDAQLNAGCGAPATDASVWFSFTATADGGVFVDVSQSDYSAGVLVGTGTPGDLELVTCGPGTVAFTAVAGTTYYILAFDDQLDGAGNGGTLSISVDEAPPASVDITVDPTGRVNARTGEVTLTGTYTCSNGDFIGISGEARQTVGVRATVVGYFFFTDFGTCDGTVQTWSATVVPEGGKFAGGKTLTVTTAFSCGTFQCADAYVEHTVKLRGGHA